MKLTDFTKLLLVALIITLASTACRKKPGTITPLHNGMTGNPTDTTPALPLTNTTGVAGTDTTSGGYPVNNPDIRKDWPRDHEIFKSDTVHFEYDRSTVRESERSKISHVADYLKANPNTALEIEGHCDERGTEEYNRSLGERRALALREQLVGLGIEANRIDTISFGKDRPVATGHDEASHSQNRRGEFVLETPPGSK
jgi:peptidoglycan-associated lipoprotein